MSGRRNTRLAGHSLVSEGSPHDRHGERIWQTGTKGWGRAKCSCGWLSIDLPSANKRQVHHRAHKRAVQPPVTRLRRKVTVERTEDAASRRMRHGPDLLAASTAA